MRYTDLGKELVWNASEIATLRDIVVADVGELMAERASVGQSWPGSHQRPLEDPQGLSCSAR